MLVFCYEVVDVIGKIDKGVIEVDSVCQVCMLLCVCGLMLLLVDVLGVQVIKCGGLSFGKWFFVQENVLVMCQFVSLLVVGLFFDEVLVVLVDQVECVYVGELFVVICVEVVGGSLLLVVLVQYLKDFFDIYCVFVLVGEYFGNFGFVFFCLVDYIESCNVFILKIKLVFMYFVIVMVVVFVIVIFLLLYVVLQVVSVFVNIK